MGYALRIRLVVSILHFNSVPLSFASNKQCKRWRAAGEHVTAHQVHEAHFEHHVGPPHIGSLRAV